MDFRLFLKAARYHLFSGHAGGHGIHSPFVFKLITATFRNKIDPSVVLTIETLRKRNLSDGSTINVLDLGGGSSRMKTNFRKVSEIARYSTVPKKYGILLSGIAAEFGNPAVVEFGTSLGFSAMYLAAGCPGSIVYTMEGCPETARLARENFSSAGIGNISSLNGSFDDLLPKVKDLNIKPGLVFIDGNHREAPLLKYFTEMAGISDENTVIIIDDIHSSAEMECAWDKIRSFETVSFTVDIFRMGMVFFRKGIPHIDYIIRY